MEAGYYVHVFTVNFTEFSQLSSYEALSARLRNDTIPNTYASIINDGSRAIFCSSLTWSQHWPNVSLFIVFDDALMVSLPPV